MSQVLRQPGACSGPKGGRWRARTDFRGTAISVRDGGAVELVVLLLDVTDTAAYLLEESIVTDSVGVHLDVSAQPGPDYACSLGHTKNPPIGTQPATVIRRVDLDRFWAMSSDLPGRPVE